MTGNAVNLFIIAGAILTYGSLTILIVRSAVRGARVDPDLASERRRPRKPATCDEESLEAVVRAMRRPSASTRPTSSEACLRARGPAQGGRRVA